MGTLDFKGIAFNVDGLMCSDSTPVESSPGISAKDIKWTRFGYHGVRLGLVLRAEGDTDPEKAAFINGLAIPGFHSGRQIELHLFLDNLSDAPVTMQLGPGDFRTFIRRAGRGVRGPATEFPPKATSSEIVPTGTLTVPPHT